MSTNEEEKPKKKGISKKMGCLTIFIFFAFVGLIASLSSKDKTNTNTATVAPSTNTKTNTVTATANTNIAALADHKVIPGDTHGTTKIVTVVAKPGVTKEQVTAINDSLINQYSSGLTHLTIEYFDDESISKDYFTKVTDLLTQDKTAEAENLAKHYIGTYTMNKTSGFNKLEYKVNGDLQTIKTY